MGSDLWNALTYLEASEANSKLASLEEYEAERAADANRDKVLKLENELINLLQSLYRNNSDISKIDLSHVEALNNYIHGRYLAKRNHSKKPVRSNTTKRNLVISSLLLVLIAVLPFLALWLKLITGGGIVFYILSIWSEDKNIQKRIENYERYVEQNRGKIVELKQRFPNLSSRGVFFKYFIDNKCKNIISILGKTHDECDLYRSLKSVYGIFELRADTSFDYPINSIEAMNHDLMIIFDETTAKYKGGWSSPATTKEEAMSRISVMYDISTFEELYDCWKEDKDIVLAAVKQYPAVLKVVNKCFKKDKEVVLASLTHSGYYGSLAYADDSLKKDKEVVEAAIARYGPNLKYADSSFKKDKKFVMKIFETNMYDNGYALEYVDDGLKADREVVLAAVNLTPDSIEYADDSLKADKEVVLAALASPGDSFKFVDKSLKNDKDVILAAKEQLTLDELIEQQYHEGN